MSDAPERIWLDGDATIDEGVFPRCFATPKPASYPPMEFVRADLRAAAIARAERAEAALAVAEGALLEAEGSFEAIFACSPARGASAIAENARNRVQAFLAKIAALKGGVEGGSTPKLEGGAQ